MMCCLSQQGFQSTLNHQEIDGFRQDLVTQILFSFSGQLELEQFTENGGFYRVTPFINHSMRGQIIAVAIEYRNLGDQLIEIIHLSIKPVLLFAH